MSWFASNLVAHGPLRSARAYLPSDDSVSDATNMMTELVLMDIQKAVDDFYHRKEEERQKKLKQLHQPDYSWLMDWKIKSKKSLSFKESSDIEALCHRLKPHEWKEVISAWRVRLADCSTRDDIIVAFHTCAAKLINERINRELEMIRETEEVPQRASSIRSQSVAELSVLSLRFPGIESPRTRTFNEPSDVV